MLLVLLCHACLVARPVDALTPFFEGVTPRAPMTVDVPCPRGTIVRSHGELGATCGVEGRPDDELVVEFYKHGSLAGYATSIEGVAHGVHRAWHPTGATREITSWRAGKLHGRHLVRGWAGDDILDEHHVDGVRHGLYTAWEGKQVKARGRYDRGLKTGRWIEWEDGRKLEGDYVAGKRTGEWEVRGAAIAKTNEGSPDLYVQFTDGKPTTAESLTDHYHGLVGGVNAAWLAVGLYGLYSKDWRIQLASGVGLTLSAPAIHALKQPASDRTAVLEKAWLARPASVGGVLLVYTIGKLFAGMDCEGSVFDGDESTGGCTQKFDKDYNWKGVAIASALSVASLDMVMAVRRKRAPLSRAWPQVSPMPIANGGGVAVAGQF
jgi:hypothetical protein